MKYSIGIVTCKYRYKKYFIPLLKKIKSIKPEIEIICCVNGEAHEDFNNEYRSDILKLCADYKNVFPMIWTTFRSLAKLWNTCIINSSENHVLILNDDVMVNEQFFEFIDQLEEQDTFTLSRSWSAFMANRRQINDTGWFDERLLGVCNEDGDMAYRLFLKYKKPVKNYFAPYDNFTSNSHGDNNHLKNQKTISKYSLHNHNFIRDKYKRDDVNGIGDGYFFFDGEKVSQHIKDIPQYPYEEYFWDNKHKL
mgnify:FL=1